MDKPTVSFNHPGFHYNNLTDRQFEELLYNLFRYEIQRGNHQDLFDAVSLMPGVCEQGRDCSLVYHHANAGLVQCKRISNRMTKPAVAREIIKFALFYLQNESLISDVDSFRYYIAASSDFSQPAIQLIDSFSVSMPDESDLEEWVNEVIEEYESFAKFTYADVGDKLRDLFSRLHVGKITPTDLNLRISCFPDLVQHHFSVLPVITQVDAEKMVQAAVALCGQEIRFMNDKNVARLAQDIIEVPASHRCVTGWVNFFGFDRETVGKWLCGENQNEILLAVAQLQAKIHQTLINKLNERLDNILLENLASLDTISPFTKQVTKPFILMRTLKKLFERLYGSELSERLCNPSTIDDLKSYFLQMGEKVLNDDFSNFTQPPADREYAIAIAKHIHCGFTGVSDMEKTFDSDIKLLLPILDSIALELEGVLPLKSIIVLGNLDLSDGDYVREVFDGLRDISSGS